MQCQVEVVALCVGAVVGVHHVVVLNDGVGFFFGTGEAMLVASCCATQKVCQRIILVMPQKQLCTMYKRGHSLQLYPSLINLTVSVDVKYHVYLLTLQLCLSY